MRENAALLVEDPKKDFRMFRVAAASPLGTKRGTGRGGLIDSVLTAVDGFYGAVAQQISPWTARAPQLPKGGRSAAEESGLDLEPPPLDHLDEDVPEPAGQPEGHAPDAVVDAAAHVERTAGAAPDDAAGESSRSTEPEPPPAGSLVSWDLAQDRLDNERRSDLLAHPAEDG